MAGKRARSEQARRNEQVTRILLLLRDLDRTGGADLYELAERYNTSVRTIRRDLEALEAAGLPLTAEGAPDSARKRWSVNTAAYRGLEKALDASHYLALRVAMGQGGALRRHSALYAALEDLGARIETALGHKARGQLEAIERCFFSWEKFAWQKAPADKLWPLVEAIAEQRLCRVHYKAPHSDDGGKKFKVLPLRLFVHQGSVYLHAWTPKFEIVLTLNLQRLVGLELLNERMEPPTDYRTEALEESAFGIFIGPDPVAYRLRFNKEVAPYIREREWHPTQKLVELDGGKVELSFRCAESYEVGSWVASWRDAVEVLAPERLKQEMRAYGEWIGRAYGEAQRARAGGSSQA